MGIKYIHLVRHGQYHMGQDNKNHGLLTALGRRQAQWAAKRLMDHEVDVFYTSTMLRARQTAEVIVNQFKEKNKVRVSGLLVEGIPFFPGNLIKKKKIKKSEIAKTKVRMNKAFKKFFTPFKRKGERHEVFVCHGNIIRYLVTKSLRIDVEKWLEFDIYQCSVTTVMIDEKGKMKLIVYGEVGHIPESKRTYI